MSPPKLQQLPVARLPNQAGAKPLSLAHQPPAKGFLSVRVAFMGEPVSKLKVEFYLYTPSGKRGAKVPSADLVTDDHGVASAKDEVDAGNYFCAIEHQPDALITTVDEIKNPLTIPLPVGRPRSELR